MNQKQVQLIHHLPGRARFRLPSLYRSLTAKEFLESELSRIPGVIKAEANPLTAGLLICFDPSQITLSHIFSLLSVQDATSSEVAAGLPAAVATPVTVESPVNRLGHIRSYLPFAGLILVSWLFSRGKGGRARRGLLNLTTEFIAYSLVIDGLGESIKEKRVSRSLATGAGALLAGSSGFPLLSMAFLSYGLLTGYLHHSANPTGIEDREVIPTFLPTISALLAGAFTRTKMRAFLPLAAGYPLAAGLGSSLPRKLMMREHDGKGWFPLAEDALDRGRNVDCLIFSGNNLISGDEESVKQIISMDDQFSEAAVLSVAASAYHNREGAMARNLLFAARSSGISLYQADNPRWEKGKGMKTIIEHRPVLVGNEQFMKAEGISVNAALPFVWRLKHLRQHPLYVAVDGRLAGLIGLSHETDMQTEQMLEGLRAAGISHLGVLSGESSSHGQTNRDHDIHEYGDHLSPGQRADLIRQLQREGHRVAFVGQDLEDIPALAVADLRIVLSNSKPQLFSWAHLAVSHESLSQMGTFFHHAQIYRQVVLQNRAILSGQAAIGSAIGLSGRISPWSALIIQALSGFLVTINSRRVKKFKFYESPANALGEVAAALSPSVIPSLSMKPVSREIGEKNSFYRELSEKLASRISWHSLTAAETMFLLQTGENGISQDDIFFRRQYFPPNRLAESPPVSWLHLLAKQFQDAMVKILIGSAGFCIFARKITDAVTILSILVINATIGVVQELKAQKSLRSLKKLSAPTARVLREGVETIIPAEDIYPGDVILLSAGDRVPADAVLISVISLEAEESSLTGETCPVAKCTGISAPDTGLAERSNMVFMGTVITRGKGTGVVVATGMQSEVGKIADMMVANENTDLTPLQQTLEGMNSFILKGCLTVSAIIFALGLFRGERLFDMFLTAVSLAVAAIPEGLTTIVTIALTLGVYRLSKKQTIVRRLPALETLGCATVICTDKTGTITKNEMTVRELFTGGETCSITGEGYYPKGDFWIDGQIIPNPGERLKKLLTAGVLCSNAGLIFEKDRWTVHGDPTEGALLAAAAKAGIENRDRLHCFQRIEEIPFDPDRRLMTVICRNEEGGVEIFSKGAPENLIPLCNRIWTGDAASPLQAQDRARVLAQAEKMASRAMRVMAIAWKSLEEGELESGEEQERHLVFCGLIGIADPPRPEVEQAITKCRAAGVKVLMISGDHPSTVRAISEEIGLLKRGEKGLVTGQEMDQMSDAELAAALENVSAVARTSPGHKMRLVQVLKEKGHVVVMTGDGVNDAPAVKEADVGIAMGLNGSDLTKDVSSLVLTDDNFATIVQAITEGRSIFTNIRNAIRYLVATNIGEVVTMLGAACLGFPLPLTPLMLLWINLAGDGLPALALVADQPDPAQMSRPPRSASEGLFNGSYGRKILRRGLLIGLAGVALYRWGLQRGVVPGRSLALAFLGASQFLHLFDCRIDDMGSLSMLTRNKYLLLAGLSGLFMLIGAIHLPSVQPVFNTCSLFPYEWAVAWAGALLTCFADRLLSGGIDRSAGKIILQPAANHDCYV